MATLHFPDHVPKGVKLGRLLSTRRIVRVYENTSLVDVETNGDVLMSLTERYVKHIQYFVWREDTIRLVIHFARQLKIETELENNLKMILWYMDEVHNAIVDQSDPDITEDSPFRSPVFDSYLFIEYFVGRHEPLNVRQYRRDQDRNIDRGDIMECGESSSILHATCLNRHRLGRLSEHAWWLFFWRTT